jgi:hypothetical protein
MVKCKTKARKVATRDSKVSRQINRTSETKTGNQLVEAIKGT